MEERNPRAPLPLYETLVAYHCNCPVVEVASNFLMHILYQRVRNTFYSLLPWQHGPSLRTIYLVCIIEKCISGENADIVVSNEPRKYAILAGYKIVTTSARFVRDS